MEEEIKFVGFVDTDVVNNIVEKIINILDENEYPLELNVGIIETVKHNLLDRALYGIGDKEDD